MEPKLNDLVWLRLSSTQGAPCNEVVRAMITNVRPTGTVDLEIGCEKVSNYWGIARCIPHRDSLAEKFRGECSHWWT